MRANIAHPDRQRGGPTEREVQRRHAVENPLPRRHDLLLRLRHLDLGTQHRFSIRGAILQANARVVQD